MRIFSLRLEIPFLGKFDPKNQNCKSKLKFGIQTNSNENLNGNDQNSMVMFTFSVFDQKYPFWINLVEKTQNCQFQAAEFIVDLNSLSPVLYVTINYT